jgi:large subunit ribosomal protein L14
MKGLSAKVIKSLTLGSILLCHDNSGVKELHIIGSLHFKGTRKRNPKVGVGDVIIASVRKGNPDKVGEVVKALIIRQKQSYRRKNGWRMQFEDNAAVLVTDDGLPVGTEIKGVVAREVSERYPKVSAIAAGII